MPIKVIPATGGGGSTSDDISNESLITGATVTDALNQIDTDISGFVTDSELTTALSTLNANNLTSGKVPMARFPDSVLGQLLYGGQVNPSTAVATLTLNAKERLGTASSTITLTNDTTAITGYSANLGIYYIASTGGTFGSYTYVTGDWLISIGTSWEKVDNTDAVSSVNGQTGAVVLTASDVGLGNVDNTSDATKNSASATLTNKSISGSSNTITNIAQSSVTNLTTDLSSKITASSTDTLTNKSISGATNTLSNIAQSSVTNLTTDLASKISASSTDTLTNKTVNLTSNTLTGTTAQFNTALSDGDFATLAGTEALTNKTIGNTNTITVKASNLTIQDDTNTAKQLRFDLSLLGASTKTYAIPNATGGGFLIGNTTSGQIIYASGTNGLITSSANFTYASSVLALTTSSTTAPLNITNSASGASKAIDLAMTSATASGNAIQIGTNTGFSGKYITSYLNGVEKFSVLSTGQILSDSLTASTVLVSDSSKNITSLANGTANQVLGMNNGATGFEYKTITAGSGVTVTHGTNSITIASTGTTVDRGKKILGTTGTTQVVNNSTTLVDIANSTITIQANKAYILRYRLVISSGLGTYACKFALIASDTSNTGISGKLQNALLGSSSGASGSEIKSIETRAIAGLSSNLIVTSGNLSGSGSGSIIDLEFIIQSKVSSRTMKLQFAQNTAVVDDMTLIKDASYVEYEESL